MCADTPLSSHFERFHVQWGSPILHPAQPRLQRFMHGVNVRAFGRVHFFGIRPRAARDAAKRPCSCDWRNPPPGYDFKLEPTCPEHSWMVRDEGRHG